jgi:hypothetical protein
MTVTVPDHSPTPTVLLRQAPVLFVAYFADAPPIVNSHLPVWSTSAAGLPVLNVIDFPVNGVPAAIVSSPDYGFAVAE